MKQKQRRNQQIAPYIAKKAARGPLPQGTHVTGDPCHRGPLSQGTPVTEDTCHRKTKDPCHKGSLSHGTLVTKDPICHIGPLPQGTHVTWGPCPKKQLSQGTPVTMDPCHMGPMSQGTPVTGDPCHRGTLLDIKKSEKRNANFLKNRAWFQKHCPTRWGPNFLIVQCAECSTMCEMRRSRKKIFSFFSVVLFLQIVTHVCD